MTIKFCEVCGDEIPYKKHQTNVKTCSEACRKEWTRWQEAIQKENYAARIMRSLDDERIERMRPLVRDAGIAKELGLSYGQLKAREAGR